MGDKLLGLLEGAFWGIIATLVLWGAVLGILLLLK